MFIFTIEHIVGLVAIAAFVIFLIFTFILGNLLKAWHFLTSLTKSRGKNDNH